MLGAAQAELQMWKPTHKNITDVSFLYTPTLILVCDTELVHCAEILIMWPIKGDWGTFRDGWVQLK